MGMPLAIRLGYHTGIVNDTLADHATARADEDAALVARARAGEYEAFETLVRKYRNDVYALSYHYVRNREEAWDLSQEVFVKVHRSLQRFRGDSSFKTWLLRITSNQCKDFFKIAARFIALFQPQTGDANRKQSNGAFVIVLQLAKQLGGVKAMLARLSVVMHIERNGCIRCFCLRPLRHHLRLGPGGIERLFRILQRKLVELLSPECPP